MDTPDERVAEAQTLDPIGLTSANIDIRASHTRLAGTIFNCPLDTRAHNRRQHNCVPELTPGHIPGIRRLPLALAQTKASKGKGEKIVRPAPLVCRQMRSLYKRFVC